MRRQTVLAAVLLPVASIGIGLGIYAAGVGRADGGAGDVDIVDSSGGQPAVGKPGMMITRQLSDAIEAAKADLTSRGVDTDRVALLSTVAVDWPDTSLGVPEPGTVYAQVVTPGFKLFLHDTTTRFEYHSKSDGTAVVFASQSSLPADFTQAPQNF